MKIVIVSQYFYPDITAGAFRAYDLYLFLKSQGVQVGVITTYPHRSNVQDVPLEGVIKTSVAPLKGKSLSSYIRHYFSFMFRAFFLSFRLKGTYDYVISISPPLFAGLAGYLIAKVKRAKFVLDIGDLWPDTAVAAGKLRSGSTIYWLGKRLEIYLYRFSDLITCVAQPMKEFILQWTKPSRVLVVYSSPPEQEIQAVADLATSLAVAPRSSPVKNIYYTGNIGSLQNLDVLVSAAEKLQEGGCDRFQIKLVGDGIERERLERHIVKRGIKSIHFIGIRTKTEIPKILLEDADILYLSLLRDPILDKTIPSKLFDYLMMNLPILYGIEGEGRKILEETGACVYFCQDRVDSLCQAIQEIVEKYEKYQQRSRDLRQLVSRRFTRELNFQILMDQLYSINPRCRPLVKSFPETRRS